MNFVIDKHPVSQYNKKMLPAYLTTEIPAVSGSSVTLTVHHKKNTGAGRFDVENLADPTLQLLEEAGLEPTKISIRSVYVSDWPEGKTEVEVC